ncbi:enoyl-CoA-hydratase DpgB [Verrucosispora sp. WMMD573]|uniref:enoyl-CoA-hydratase DpgB n=1 Tax=Verrucosispora sp. WMMD573 TaxID=3015149 RepID=UPI00248AB28F|nr:enoyl-CoA-hydratase DpgB [Verrucosispora sp. WMMD573]WBB57571.1 enoyl-CoA hydratase/isomerase family protein [Verrucosispora sp. WMMD573]
MMIMFDVSASDDRGAVDVSGEVFRLGDETALELVVDATRGLAAVTAVVNAASQRAEDHAGQQVILLRMAAFRQGEQSWPGAVTIKEVNSWERAVRRLERSTAVCITVADGVCGGPTLDLLLATDYRIVSTDCRIFLPINAGHCWPGMALHRLVQRLGLSKARQLVLWGHELNADEALRLGLVDEVAPPEQLDTTWRSAAMLMGPTAGFDLAMRRQLLLEAIATEFDDALGTHLAACDRELRRLVTSRVDESKR